jgi:phosphonate transport system substrate-binding protein
MKTQKMFGKASLLRNVIVVAALAVSFSVPTVATAAVSVKSGDACSKSQLNKASGKLKCTYNSKTKKYSWAASTAASTNAKANWPKELIFGFVPAENIGAMQTRIQPSLDYLSKKIGLPIKFYSATDYAGVIEAAAAGRVDVVEFGPFQYVLALARGAKIEPIAGAVRVPTGKPAYYSYGIARGSDASVKALSDFKGKNICFTDPGSTSGALYPTAGLLGIGLKSTDYRATYAGGHDLSVLSVAKGTCEVGFAYDDMVDIDMINDGRIKKGDIKGVWKSEAISGSPISVSLNLPKDLQAIVKSAILGLNVDNMVADGFCTASSSWVKGTVLKDCNPIYTNHWGWVPVSDSLYDGVRRVCETTKSSKCK